MRPGLGTAVLPISAVNSSRSNLDFQRNMALVVFRSFQAMAAFLHSPLATLRISASPAHCPAIRPVTLLRYRTTSHFREITTFCVQAFSIRTSLIQPRRLLLPGDRSASAESTHRL